VELVEATARSVAPTVTSLSPAAQAFLRAAIAPNTRKKYEAHFKRWQAWLAAHPGTPTDQLALANWLAEETSSRDLRADAVEARRAAICTITQENTGQSLAGTDILLRRVLCGVKKTVPGGQTHTDQTWDLDRVLIYLAANSGNNCTISSDELLQKTAFLLEVAGARAADLTTIVLTGSILTGADGNEHDMHLKYLPKTSKKKFAVLRVHGCAQTPSICAHCAFTAWLNRLPPGKTAVKAFIFPADHRRAGQPISSDWLRNSLVRLLRAAGIPKQFGAHSIRHAAASKAAMLGAPELVVKAMFGWSPSGQTLSQHYLHIATTTSASVVALLMQGVTRGMQALPTSVDCSRQESMLTPKTRSFTVVDDDDDGIRN